MRTSLRAIADEVGVSHSAVRHHFRSIEALMLEVVAKNDWESSQWLAAQQESDLTAEMVAGASRNAGLPGVVAIYTSMLALAAGGEDDEVRAFYARRFAQGRVALVAALRVGRPDLIDDAQASAVASLVMAAFDGLQIQWLLDPSVDLAGSMAELRPLLGDAPATYAAFQALSKDLLDAQVAVDG